jgi:hypothetical protein
MTIKANVAKSPALGIAVLCARNTCIEDIHSGTEPASTL